jgi:glycosyltransferase involved in cell wall biosynthesis
VGAAASTSKPIRIVRVIARLNMGGPAHHVGVLGSRLDPERYETLLLHGEVGAGEDSLEDFVRARGATMARVPGLRPELRPHDDARALGSLVRAIRRLRPDIVDTHTAKAGMLGRLAAVMAGPPRPKIVHTYHGHVLEGYFGRVQTATYRELERRLATVSDALIGVSRATVDDLVRLGIAPREKFRVIPLGLDLKPFLEADPDAGFEFRREVGVRDGELLVTFVGRLAAIKRGDVLLRAFARARSLGAGVRLAVVGDGEQRPHLEQLASDLGVRDHVYFAGYRAEMLPIAAAADIAVLSSDNEGTPVSLIEAAAGGTPAVATRVGGVPDVVADGAGILAAAGDHHGLAAGIATLAGDASLRAAMGDRARQHVKSRFSVIRLVDDMEALYRELLRPTGAKVSWEALRTYSDRAPGSLP